MQKGNIQVQAENIFPIIKQFLYSDQEIFLRELVSNAVDATTKLKAKAAKGETGEIGDTTIEIIADKEAKTLTIRDRGIGMTEEEVEKYLNQVAFSSAEEFLEQYKDSTGIIGHFGLGFYSAFMVADKVEVVTQSFKEGADAVRWTCEGQPEYTIEAAEREMRGTDVILHISDDSEEYLEEGRISELLNKYCRFLPVPIQFGTTTRTEGEGDDAVEVEEANIVNNPEPLWKKSPNDLTDEDYKSFYQELYPFSSEPLFWIHLNIDYPFNLTGVLYFPKLNNALEIQKNKIQLYSNQVFITDDVSQIVPEYLMLLHGVIDSPDIPLNVSRSYLQSDRNVKKISGYITKKVAEKLKELFKDDRPAFQEKWSDIGTFVKYGIISDEKFAERATKFTIFKNTEGEFYTTEEYKEKIKDTQTDKHDKINFLYTNSEEEHDSYITAARNNGYDVLVMNDMIDNHFMQQVEMKESVNFIRVDSDTVDNLIQKDEEKESVLSEDEQKKVEELFGEVVQGSEATVVLKPLSPDDFPVQITRPEFMRRFKEMQALQGQAGMMGAFPDSYNVVVNTNHPLVSKRLVAGEASKEVADHLYKIALLNQGMLKGKDLTAFALKSLSYLEQQ